MGNLTELGLRFKIKLLQEGKSQVWFAKRLGVSKQLITNILYGEVNQRIEEAIKNYIETGEVNNVKDNN